MRVEASVDNHRDGTMRLLVRVACTSLAFWLALVELALAQSDGATDGSGALWPWGVGVPAAGGAAWWLWQQRDRILPIAKSLAGKIGLSGNARARRPADDTVIADDNEEEDATKVIKPVIYGTITCVSGTLIGQRWDIPARGLMIGRDPESDVVIDDPRVSARHAQIRPKNGQVFVVDYASKNGVFLNTPQNRIEGEAPLSPRDRVLLSPTDAAHFLFRK